MIRKALVYGLSIGTSVLCANLLITPYYLLGVESKERWKMNIGLLALGTLQPFPEFTVALLGEGVFVPVGCALLLHHFLTNKALFLQLFKQWIKLPSLIPKSLNTFKKPLFFMSYPCRGHSINAPMIMFFVDIS